MATIYYLTEQGAKNHKLPVGTACYQNPMHQTQLSRAAPTKGLYPVGTSPKTSFGAGIGDWQLQDPNGRETIGPWQYTGVVSVGFDRLAEGKPFFVTFSSEPDVGYVKSVTCCIDEDQVHLITPQSVANAVKAMIDERSDFFKPEVSEIPDREAITKHLLNVISFHQE